MHSRAVSLTHTHAQTAAERLMIFTLINSVNKACRGRIYTQDYIGLINKKKKERKKKKETCVGGVTKREERREEAQAGSKQPGGETRRL